jgi:putative two-component system response regulator
MPENKQVIILVDDNQSNLMIGRNVLKDKYEVYTIPSGANLQNLLRKIKADLILLDSEMPGMSGFEVIAQLKENPESSGIPVILLSSWNDPKSELEGFSLGAVDFIYKPFSIPLLLKRVENQLLIQSIQAELRKYQENQMERYGSGNAV